MASLGHFFPPLETDLLGGILKTRIHIMSVGGVLCVLGPDRGCVFEGHEGGGGFPAFSAGPICVFLVPRMGQPSMLREGDA